MKQRFKYIHGITDHPSNIIVEHARR